MGDELEQSSASAEANSNASAEPESNGIDLTNDGEYIVIERLGPDGQTVEGYSRFQYANGKDLISGAIAQDRENQVALVENDLADGEDAQPAYETVMFTCSVVIVAALFMCLGAIASRTLLRSFEK